MKKTLLTAAILGMLAIPPRPEAQIIRTGRSVGLASAAVTSMLGAHARGWNPASLARANSPKFGLSTASFGGSFGNNAFTPQYIGETFVEDADLSSQIKEEILSKLDADQFRLYSYLGVPVVGVSAGQFAFNLDAHLIVRTALPEDIFRLALRGPEVDREYKLDNLSAESISFWAASLSTAKSLTPPAFFSEFAVGATFKYLGGLGMQSLDRHEGVMKITHERLLADASLRNLTATSGDGVGLDLGASAKLDAWDVELALTLGNLVGGIVWSNVEAKEKQVFRNEGIHPDSLTNNDYWKRFFNETDTTYTLSDHRTSLPTYLLMGASRPLLNELVTASVSYYQGLDEDAGQVTTPRLGLGAELYFIPVFPLRVGMSFGGQEEYQLTGGFGLRLPGFQFDFGASWQRGVAASAQGFSLAITNTFGPMPKRN